MEQILKCTTPVAKKDYVCCTCGQKIEKGTKYTCIAYKVEKKVTSRRYHYTCNVGGNQSNHMTEAQFWELTKQPMSEEQYKEFNRQHTAMMVETFTSEELMQISFVPLIIQQIVWFYANKVVAASVEGKVPQFCKYTREVKALKVIQEQTWAKDLKKKEVEKFKKESGRFISECSRDLTILWYTLNSKIKKYCPQIQYIEIRTDAYCGIVMCKLYYRHAVKMAELIESRTDNYSLITDEKITRLKGLLEGYLAPLKGKYGLHVNNALAIMNKNLGKIDFNIV